MARIASHNQLQAVVAIDLKSSLVESLPEDCHTFGEKSLAATGLRLQRVRAEEIFSPGGSRGTQSKTGHCQNQPLVTRFRPDFLEARDNFHLGADATIRHVACADGGLQENDTEMRTYPISLATLVHPRRLDPPMGGGYSGISGYEAHPCFLRISGYTQVEMELWKDMIENVCASPSQCP